MHFSDFVQQMNGTSVLLSNHNTLKLPNTSYISAQKMFLFNVNFCLINSREDYHQQLIL